MYKIIVRLNANENLRSTFRGTLVEYTASAVEAAIIYHIRALVKVNCGRRIATSSIVGGASTAIKSCIAISARISALPRGFVASANVTTIHYERLKQNAGSSLSHNRKHFLFGVSESEIKSERNAYFRDLMKLTVQSKEICTNLNAPSAALRLISSFPWMLE